MGIQIIIVPGSQDAQVGEEFFGIEMIPPQGIGAVLPINSRWLISIILLLEVIHPVVDAEKNAVVRINVVIQLQVKIRKVQIVQPVVKYLDRLGNVRAPARNEKRDVLLPDGTLQWKARWKKSHTAVETKSIHIPILGPDIDQAGEPPPIIGRKISLVNLNILDGIGNNGTEEAQKVGGIVQLSLIDGNQVLVPSPSPYIEDGWAITKKLNPRNGRKGFNHIFLSEQGRHLSHRLGINSLLRTPGGSYNTGIIVGIDGDFTQPCQLLLKHEMDVPVGDAAYRNGGLPVAHKRTYQLLDLLFQSQGIESVFIGDGPL